MKWLRWLFGDSSPVKVEETLDLKVKEIICCDDMGTKDCCKEEVSEDCCDDTGTKDCCKEIEDKVEGFVDEKTGKVYKTASALKSVQTRRKNAKAKLRKKSKK